MIFLLIPLAALFAVWVYCDLHPTQAVMPCRVRRADWDLGVRQNALLPEGAVNTVIGESRWYIRPKRADFAR